MIAQKLTEPAQSEGENDSTETESLDSTSSAPKQLPRKGPLVKDPADCIQSVLKNS